jgi:hypothetical protein
VDVGENAEHRLHHLAGRARLPGGDSDAGQRTRDGQSQDEIAGELRPLVENILDELDRWLSVSAPPAQR